MKWMGVVLIFLPLIVVGQESCELISFKGIVHLRTGYQEAWDFVKNNQRLEFMTTIRTGQNSEAILKTMDNAMFTLPANAQIEVRELKQLTRDEVVMELTAMELQKLPAPDEREKPAQAFVLHGAPPELNDTDAQNQYIHLEENGAVALYEQGFISGFILKWNRLHYQFPEIKLSEADQFIESAYTQMKMPGRLKAVKQ